MSLPTTTSNSLLVGDSAHQLIRLLGSALCDAVDHLDYIGWGDEWEREAKESIEPAIREAVNQYQAFLPYEKEKEAKAKIWICGKCGREFKSRTSRRQHTMHSTKCQPNSSFHPPQVGCDESSDHDSHDEQTYDERP